MIWHSSQGWDSSQLSVPNILFHILCPDVSYFYLSGYVGLFEIPKSILSELNNCIIGLLFQIGCCSRTVNDWLRQLIDLSPKLFFDTSEIKQNWPEHNLNTTDTKLTWASFFFWAARREDRSPYGVPSGRSLFSGEIKPATPGRVEKYQPSLGSLRSFWTMNK